jgi:iron complex outermembrane receptor protein
VPSSRSQVRSDGAGAAFEFDAPAWGGIANSHAVGLDLRRDRFDASADAQTQAGEVLGQGEVPPRQRNVARDYAAAWYESLWHPRDTLEVTVAARFDRYEDAGAAFSPKLGVAWRPSGTLLLRASAGRGFQAPDLVSAYGGFATGSALVVDDSACAARPGDAVACSADLVEVSLVPNADLGPEHARQGSLGLAWDPVPALHFGLDYVHTRVEDEIGRLDARDALRNELECAQGGDTCDPVRDGQVLRDANGNIEGVVLPRINIAGTKLRALDGEAEARLGDFRLQLRASRVLEFERQVQATLPRQHLAGASGRPRWRGQLHVDWQRGSHGATLGAAFTARQRNCAFLDSSDGAIDATCNGGIPSHLVLDAQWRWQAPWRAAVALGVRNLADRQPAFDVLGNFSYGLYDPTGRTWYLRYEQAF